MFVTDDCMLQAGLDAYANTHQPLAGVVTHFGRLLCAQRAVSATLPIAMPGAISVEEAVFLAGEPLGARLEPALFPSFFRQAAEALWPFLGEEFPPLREPLGLLAKILEQDSCCMDCLWAVVRGDAEALHRVASQAGVGQDMLLFALRTAYGPCIAALRPQLAELPLVTLWRKCFCPICGSDPDLETLELHPDEKDYVVSQSGEAWLHCPQCHQHWRFTRAVCPSCGNQENDKLTRLSLPDAPYEFLYACDACHKYLPCLDLTAMPENGRSPDLAFAALKMVHLDAIAQKRGYTPLSPAPWTGFGFHADSVGAL